MSFSKKIVVKNVCISKLRKEEKPSPKQNANTRDSLKDSLHLAFHSEAWSEWASQSVIQRAISICIKKFLWCRSTQRAINTRMIGAEQLHVLEFGEVFLRLPYTHYAHIHREGRVVHSLSNADILCWLTFSWTHIYDQQRDHSLGDKRETVRWKGAQWELHYLFYLSIEVQRGLMNWTWCHNYVLEWII